MPKMPKSLSMNSRARATASANRSLDWSGRTSIRSGSKIVAAMMDAGPREKRTFEEQVTALKERLRREQNRLSKMKLRLKHVVLNSDEAKDLQAKILKKDGHCNRLIFNLEDVLKLKQAKDEQEAHRFKYNPRGVDYIGEGEKFVRLEKGKIVPSTGHVLFNVRRKNEGAPRLSTIKEAELVRKERAETARKTRLEKMTIKEVYEAQKEEGIHTEAAQKAIESVFVDEISEEDFEEMFK